MRKSFLLVEHITISSVVLFILLGILSLSFTLVQNILINPLRYFNTQLSVEETQFFIVYISLVVISVLIAYIIYLLLSLNTRTQLMVLNSTKSLDISLRQLQNLYEVAPVPYIILNEKGEINESNKAALRFFEVTEKEIVGKSLFSYQPKEDADEAEKLLRYYKSNIPIDKEEIRVITKNGAVRWVLLSVFEMKNIKSSGRTGLATLFDITEQKKLDQAKTEFVSLASHQLHSPVATVKWYMDMLLSGDLGELSPKQKDYMERLQNVNKEMIELIETLLNVSRIEIGSLKIEIKLTNVIELTEGILEELSSQIELKKIIVDKQYDDNLKNIDSDPKLLRIAIQNLLTNAVKYTPEGGTVIITFKESFMEKAIIVSDTGVGIPEKEQDKVFTKLFRADNVRSLSGSQGTGLGLYLVKSIVEQMGGKISFISEENKGSTFTIKL